MENKAHTVAYWHYEGNHPGGEDHPRKGTIYRSRDAHAYYREHGNDDVVQRVAPSRAGCRAEVSDFGRVYSFRILNPAKLDRWLESVFEADLPE